MYLGQRGPFEVEGKSYFPLHPGVIGPSVLEPGGQPLDMPGDFEAIEDTPYGAVPIAPFETVTVGPMPGWMSGLGYTAGPGTTTWVYQTYGKNGLPEPTWDWRKYAGRPTWSWVAQEIQGQINVFVARFGPQWWRQFVSAEQGGWFVVPPLEWEWIETTPVTMVRRGIAGEEVPSWLNTPYGMSGPWDMKKLYEGQVTFQIPKPPWHSGEWPPKPDSGGFYSLHDRKIAQVLYARMQHRWTLIPILHELRGYLKAWLGAGGRYGAYGILANHTKEQTARFKWLLGVLPTPPWHDAVRHKYVSKEDLWSEIFFWWDLKDGEYKYNELVMTPTTPKAMVVAGIATVGGVHGTARTTWGKLFKFGFFPPFLWEKRAGHVAGVGVPSIIHTAGDAGDLNVKYTGRGNAPSYPDLNWVYKFPFPTIKKEAYKLSTASVPNNTAIAKWADDYNAAHPKDDHILVTTKNVDGRRFVTIWGPIRIKETEPGTFAKLAAKAGMVAPVAMLIPGAGVAVATALKAISTAAAVEGFQTARDAEKNLRSLEDSLIEAAKAGTELTIQDEAALNAWATQNWDLMKKAGTTPEAFNRMTATERAGVLAQITMIKEEEARRAKTKKIVGYSALGLVGVGLLGTTIWVIARRR